MLLLELVVHHSLHEARLSNSCVTDDDELEEVILLRQCLVLDDLERDLFDLFDLALLHLNSFSPSRSILICS